LNAEWENAKAQLGESLLPLALQLTDALLKLLEGFNNLSPGTQQAIVYIGLFAAAIGPLLGTLGTLSTIVGGIITKIGGISTAFSGASTAAAGLGAVFSGPLILAIVGLGLQIAVLAVGWKQNWFYIQDTVKLVTENIKSVFNAFIAILKGDWTRAGNELKTAWQRTWDEINRRVDTITPKIVNSVKNMGKLMIGGLVSAIRAGMASVVSAMVSVATAAINAAKAVLGIQSPSKVFAGIGTEIMAGMAQGIRGGLGQPVGALAYATPQMAGAAGVNVTMNNNVNSNLDIEYLAQRVARVIKANQR